VWLEGNPLTPEAVAGLLAALPASNVSALGLDSHQLDQLPLAERQALVEAAGSKLRVGGAVPGSTQGPGSGSGPGYFKLETAPPAAASAGNGSSRPTTEVLVVSFGSAPGTPNWGGLLKKVRAAAMTPEEQNFDVLYVVDPARSWYGGELAPAGHIAAQQAGAGAQHGMAERQVQPVVARHNVWDALHWHPATQCRVLPASGSHAAGGMSCQHG